jgi:hypothetical protein
MAEIGFRFLRTLNACDDKANGADVAFVLGVREVPGACWPRDWPSWKVFLAFLSFLACWDSVSY